MFPVWAQAPTIPITQITQELVLIQENSLVGNITPFLPENRSETNLTRNSRDLKGRLGKILSKKYPELTELLIDLISCESGFDKSKCGDNGISCGILQFKEETFLTYCKGQWLNTEDQILCAEKMIQNGLGKQHWKNCWKKMNLNKYSELTKISNEYGKE